MSSAPHGRSSGLMSLPPELIEYIVELGCPRMSFATYRQRFVFLSLVSLINRQLASLARPRLIKHVLINCGVRSRSQMAFVRNHVCSSTKGRDCGINSVRLRFDKPGDQDSQFRATWDDWPPIQQLWIVGSPSGVTWLTLTSLRELAPSLTLLCLDNVGLLESESLGLPSLVFPHLRVLSLSDPIVFPPFGRSTEPWVPFLSAQSCPSLCSITLTTWTHSIRSSQLGDLCTALISVAPQLTHFTIKPSAAVTLGDVGSVFSHLTALKHLGLPTPMDVIPHLSALPSTLSSLRLFSHYVPDSDLIDVDWNSVLDIVRAWPEPALSSKPASNIRGPSNQTSRAAVGFSKLVVPRCADTRILSEIDRACKDHGVRLEQRELPYDDYVEQWEDLVDA